MTSKPSKLKLKRPAAGTIRIWVCIFMLTAVFPVWAGETIRLEARHSHLLTTDEPVTRVSVADPKIADVTVLTPTSVLVVAKTDTAGATSLILWFGEDWVAVYDVHVHTMISPGILTSLRARIAEFAPGVELEVLEAGTDPDQPAILLKGEVDSQEILNRIMTVVNSFNLKYFNLIRLTGSQQVQLKVMIAEISKTGLRQMGINFARMSDHLGTGVFQGGGSSSIDFSGSGNGETISDNISVLENSANGNRNTTGTTLQADYTLGTPFGTAFQIALNSSKHNWMSVLSLLKSQGLARSLATPTLVTMNGQRAEFQAGGEFPVPVQGEGGSVTMEYREYGVMLGFTPYILDQDTITIEVSPEVSSLDYSVQVTSGGATVPGLTTRKATTTLQLKTGQTFAMAGLLQEDYYQTVSKVPFLGDIPYLGSLFTAKEHSLQERELVVMVTPTIVRAMDENQVPPLPGENLNARTSDTDFFIKNKLENTGPSAEVETPVFKGKTGFIK